MPKPLKTEVLNFKDNGFEIEVIIEWGTVIFIPPVLPPLINEELK